MHMTKIQLCNIVKKETKILNNNIGEKKQIINKVLIFYINKKVT